MDSREELRKAINLQIDDIATASAEGNPAAEQAIQSLAERLVRTDFFTNKPKAVENVKQRVEINKLMREIDRISTEQGYDDNLREILEIDDSVNEKKLGELGDKLIELLGKIGFSKEDLKLFENQEGNWFDAKKVVQKKLDDLLMEEKVVDEDVLAVKQRLSEELENEENEPQLLDDFLQDKDIKTITESDRSAEVLQRARRYAEEIQDRREKAERAEQKIEEKVKGFDGIMNKTLAKELSANFKFVGRLLPSDLLDRGQINNLVDKINEHLEKQGSLNKKEFHKIIEATLGKKFHQLPSSITLVFSGVKFLENNKSFLYEPVPGLKVTAASEEAKRSPETNRDSQRLSESSSPGTPLQRIKNAAKRATDRLSGRYPKGPEVPARPSTSSSSESSDSTPPSPERKKQKQDSTNSGRRLSLK